MDAREAIRSYYGFSAYTDQVIDRMLTTPGQIHNAIAAFGDLGTDEVMLY